MMEIWRIILNAFWNGLSEILPISAFGHFELLREITVDNSDTRKMIVRFSCIGVVAAILIFYKKDIKKSLRNKKGLLLTLLLALPSIIIFCLLEGKFPEIFYNLMVVGAALLVMSLIMLNFTKLSDLAHKKAKKKAVYKTSSALVSGLLASISVLPGFSRVAILIMSLRLYGVEKHKAIKAAIFAGIPVLVAMVVKCLCYGGVDFVFTNPWVVLLAVVMGFAASYLSLMLIRKLQKKHDVLRVFGWYQLVLALVVLVFELIK